MTSPVLGAGKNTRAFQSGFSIDCFFPDAAKGTPRLPSPSPRAAPLSNIGFANALADGPPEHGERHDARVRHTRRAPSLTPTPAPWQRGRPRGSRSLHPPAAASASGEDSRLPSDNISGDSDSASQRGKLRPRSIITSPSSFPPQYNKSSNPGTVASAFLFVDF